MLKQAAALQMKEIVNKAHNICWDILTAKKQQSRDNDAPILLGMQELGIVKVKNLRQFQVVDKSGLE